MKFSKTRETLEKIESGDEKCSLKAILGIMVLDLYTDIKKETSNGYEKLMVDEEDEAEVIIRLTNLAKSVNRIYKNNEIIFSDENKKSRFEKANLGLSKLVDQAEEIEEECKEFKKKIQEIESENFHLQSLLEEKTNLEDLLTEKQHLHDNLNERIAKTDELNSELEKLSKEIIPSVEAEIIDLSNNKLPALQEELKKQERNRNDLQKSYENQCEKYNIENRKINSLNINIRSKKEETEKLIVEQKRQVDLAREWEIQQLSIVEDLKKEEEHLKLQDKKNRDDIDGLKTSINTLKLECKKEEGIIGVLEEEKLRESDNTNDIKGRRRRLEDELRTLREANGVETKSNEAIQAEIDIYRNEKDDAQQTYEKLVKQRDETERAIQTLKEKNAQETILGKSLYEDLQKYKISYDKSKKEIKEKKEEFQKAKNEAIIMIKNKEIQAEAFLNHQKTFGNKIAMLIGDAKTLMYADTAERVEIEKKLVKQKEDLEKNLNEELRIYQDLLSLFENKLA